MKIIIFAVAMAIAWIGVAICPVWAFIEFLLYLVKDREFNWWSIWTLCICLVCGIFLIFYVEYLKQKENMQATNGPVSSKPRRSSRFQQKLDEIEAARKERENSNN